MESKILANVAATDGRVVSYEYDPDNDAGIHWLHLRYPLTSDGAGAIHERTVKDCLESLRRLDHMQG